MARRGVDCRIVQRSAPGFQGSRGAGLPPRTREIFEDLGVLDTVHAAGGTYPLIRRWDGDTPLGTSDIMERSDPTPDRPYGEMWMLPQWRTMEILAGSGVPAVAQTVGHRAEFGRLTQHRRLVRDYEALPQRSRAMIHWAMANKMSRELTGESTPTWRFETDIAPATA
ncbi:FAD-dependent monooxygenase [Streptomyces mirabilis]|uniref:FAD-dependent monooxygenase n=1 Tax=Streptomyces mirabilis TaxID=68239 RepID=UPI003F4DC11A